MKRLLCNCGRPRPTSKPAWHVEWEARVSADRERTRQARAAFLAQHVCRTESLWDHLSAIKSHKLAPTREQQRRERLGHLINWCRKRLEDGDWATALVTRARLAYLRDALENLDRHNRRTGLELAYGGEETNY